MLVGSIPPSVINFSHLAEVTVPVKWLTDSGVHPWMGKLDLAPRLLLTVNFSLVSHPLSSLINDCLSLPSATQGRSWRLREGYFL